MSHYLVTVRVTAKRLAAHGGDMSETLEAMLAPFEESPKAGSPFLVFDDRHVEARVEYETGKTTQTRGSTPTNMQETEVPFTDVYPTFAEFAKDYHGYEPHPETKRYGRWHNPNAKWDWWTIGGRWTGFYPLPAGAKPALGESGAFGNAPTPGHGDLVRVREIDMSKVAADQIVRAEEFWGQWLQFVQGVKLDAWNGPRRTAIDLGLIQVVESTVVSTETTVAISWAGTVPSTDNRKGWTDVCNIVTHEDFMRDYIDHFNPITTYAALDNDGWHAPGTMGWFACSDESPGQSLAFKREFVKRFIDGAADDDTLVVVDCHI